MERNILWLLFVWILSIDNYEKMLIKVLIIIYKRQNIVI